MKKQLLQRLRSLVALLIGCFILRLAFCLFLIANLVVRRGIHTIEPATQFILGEWLTRGNFEAAALLLFTLLLAYLKLHHSPRRLKPNQYTWLSTSPWTPGKPLPGGDFNLGYSDAFTLISIEALLYFFTDWNTGIASYLFAIFYFIGLFAISFNHATWKEWYGTLSLLALPVLFLDYFSHLVAATFIFCWILSLRAQKLSWKSWLGLDKNTSHKKTFLSVIEIGWPWCAVSEFQEMKVKKHALLLSSVIALWLYTIFHHPEVSENFGILKYWLRITSLIAFVHWISFINIGKPALSIRGRIINRKFILQGYDHVHVTPLLCILSSVIVFTIVSSVLNIFALAESLAIASAIYVCLRTSPSWKSWFYTGKFSPKPLISKTGFYEKI